MLPSFATEQTSPGRATTVYDSTGEITYVTVTGYTGDFDYV